MRPVTHSDPVDRMTPSVLTPASPAEPADSSFLVGCTLGVVLAGAIAVLFGVLLLKL